LKQFSHSKLQTYERCPLNYKYKYIVHLKPSVENTIDAFMGGLVHDALELLYKGIIKTKLNSLERLLEFYEDEWKKQWSDLIIINDKEFDKEHYFELGKKCIVNYYEKFYPFDQDQTLGVEKSITLNWDGYEIIGYIDRLARDNRNHYSVHDYKSGSLMGQEYADKDRQLALYSIAVKQNFREAKRVRLIWHYVAFGEDIISERTDKQLAELKAETLELISEINLAEQKNNFPARETKCEWCGYHEYCPKKKHHFKLESLPVNEYLQDSGVKLAKKYIEFYQKRSAINKKAREEAQIVEQEIKQIEDAIFKYAEKNQLEVLSGGSHLVCLKKNNDFDFPRKSAEPEEYQKLDELLRNTEYWDGVSELSFGKIKKFLDEGILEKNLADKIIEISPPVEKNSISIRKK
jgi:putative RecB family exonuclease